MTGNDIVDIATAFAESNWRRKGFLEKIFTPQEQQYIREAASPGEMVWRLWSMKESACKVYSRQSGNRFYAPQKFNCTIVNASAGQVDINKVTYQTTTNTTKEYVYSIARPDEVSKISFMNCCFRLPEPAYSKQSHFIYEKLISQYTILSGKERSEIELVKNNNGIPFLYCRQDELHIPVSITHHGNYGAFTVY